LGEHPKRANLGAGGRGSNPQWKTAEGQPRVGGARSDTERGRRRAGGPWRALATPAPAIACGGWGGEGGGGACWC
jgi:hypothetical protein